MDGKTLVTTLVPSLITEVSYGQDVHRRVGTAVAVRVFTLGAGALVAQQVQEALRGFDLGCRRSKRRICNAAVRQERLSRCSGGLGRNHWKESRRFRSTDRQELASKDSTRTFSVLEKTMRKSRPFSIAGSVLVLTLACAFAAATLHSATCTGSDPCHACKNCKYCRHCAKEGGKCGVCK